MNTIGQVAQPPPIVARFELHPIGLRFPPAATFEEWRTVGAAIRFLAKGWQWWHGDWVSGGECRWGDKYAQEIAVTGLAYSTVAIHKHVAESFDFLRRRKNLEWAHHREVAGTRPAIADKLLDQAESTDPVMKVSALRLRVATLKVSALGTSAVLNEFDEAAAIESWLRSRLGGWPDDWRPTFPALLRRLAALIEEDLS